MFEKIDELLAQLRALPPLSVAAEERLMEEFMVRYTYNSNAIEGSTLTERETALVLKDDMTIEGKPLKYHLDAIGHRDAFALVCREAEAGTELTEELIKRIHSHVLLRDEEERGHCRTVNVYISGSDVVLPSAQFVPDKMAALMARYNGEMQDWHPIRRAAVFHLAFESVHPFIDGNGRTGRLILNFELMKAGYPPIDVKFTDKDRYYYCLQSYQGQDETKLPMLYMLETYMEQTLREQIETLTQARDLKRRNKDER